MTQTELKIFIENSNIVEGIYDKNEIKNSLKAWKYLKNKKSKNITIEDISKIHYYIMKDLNLRIAGNFRKVNVCIMSGYEVIRKCPNHERVLYLLDQWVDTYGKEVKNESEAKESHIQFEKIHPFEDGNGRTGRLLWLYQRDYLKLPFEYIGNFNKFEYYKWFK